MQAPLLTYAITQRDEAIQHVVAFCLHKGFPPGTTISVGSGGTSQTPVRLMLNDGRELARWWEDGNGLHVHVAQFVLDA